MGDACKMAMQFGQLQTSGGPGGHGSIPVIVHPTQPAMSQVFAFGDRRPEFPVPVLNERAVRAAAGIVFLFAIVSFMNAWLIGNFQPTRVFVVAFLIDFTIRIFVNPTSCHARNQAGHFRPHPANARPSHPFHPFHPASSEPMMQPLKTQSVPRLAAALVLLTSMAAVATGLQFDFIHFGNFTRMNQSGHVGGEVALSKLPQRAGDWGLGATAGLKGEIVQVDGKLLVSPGSDAQGRVQAPQPDEQAVLFAGARVQATPTTAPA